MSARVLAVWPKPEDAEAFDKHYDEVHMPLTRKMPGLRRAEVHRASKNVMPNEDVYVVTVLHFDDRAAAEAALGSDEGMAAGKDAYKLSGGRMQIFVADTSEVTV